MTIPSRPDRSIRIVSYNILYGGQDRLDLIAEAIAALDADIIGLQEANDPANVARLAEKLGYHHAVAESQVSPFHVALISRRPILAAANLSLRCAALQRSALRATIDMDGEAWRVVVLHLAPGGAEDREALRMRELDDLLPVLDEDEDHGRPTVMMGDFNSTALHHPHGSPQQGRDAGPPPPAGNSVPRDVAHRLTEAGWTDAVHVARPDQVKHTITPKRPTTRVDYIWLCNALAGRLLDADVEQNHRTATASDHYPVWALLRQPAAAPPAG